MTKNKNTHVVGKSLTKFQGRTAKKFAASAQTLRGHTVTAKSGKIISCTVTKHRDALKRLADR